MDFGQTQGLSTQSGSIKPGIHKAKFTGVAKGTINTKNGMSNVITFTFEVNDHGPIKHNVFEPLSSQRTEGQFGQQPSQEDHFLLNIRQVLAALVPDTLKEIDKNPAVMGSTFDQMADKVCTFLAPALGKEVELKFLPNGNYSNIPTYVASISRDGNLYVSTTWIGHNLTLTSKESARIVNAQNATPTTMAKRRADLLEQMGEDLGQISGNSADDLPF